MESTVSFQNEGLIDLLAVKTFGASSKGIDNPIGFFGTGLKYSIAIILRNGGMIKLYRGLDEYIFTAVNTKIRNDNFQLVMMNDGPLGFTTALGKTWKLWQAFRELYCNTTDETGFIKPIKVEPKEGHTTITVTGDKFLDCYHNRDKFLVLTKPQYVCNGVEIHNAETSNIFYRGILVTELEKGAEKTYNITSSIDLTEDRTAKYSFEWIEALSKGILTSDSKDAIYDFISAEKDSFEANFPFRGTPGETFMDVMSNISFRECTNMSAIALYKRASNTVLSPDQEELNEVEVKQLTKAINFCTSHGFKVEDYPIVVTTDLDHNTLGMAYNKQIFLSRRVFQMGTKMVAGTLIEEWLHLKEGLLDESRGLQNYLFDTIVTLCERLDGEPI